MNWKSSFCAAAVFALAASPTYAQISDGVIKIGVMNDQSGTYADLAGPGSVVAARMAVEDFGAAKKRMKVEIVVADHQNKPEVGSGIARQWYDVDKVDAIVDVPTSSVALAVNQITRDKNKVLIVSTGATVDLTGKSCSPNTIHWTYDTWALANGTGNAVVKNGGDTWFFLTADYAFGHSLEQQTEAVVLKNGGKVLGKGRVRQDGRKIHNMYLFEVKKPSESKGAWDYYKLRGTIPAEQAFRPEKEGGCALVK
jgi:branched-chain amino acid transport system substrate-binding protein